MSEDLSNALAEGLLLLNNVVARRKSVKVISGQALSVYGDYDVYTERTPKKLLRIIKGFSKNKRKDLKQFMFSLLCVGGNIPLIGKTVNGNSSDNNLNNTMLMEVAKLIREGGWGLTLMSACSVIKIGLKK